jgi:hypothetical protein
MIAVLLQTLITATSRSRFHVRRAASESQALNDASVPQVRRLLNTLGMKRFEAVMVTPVVSLMCFVGGCGGCPWTHASGVTITPSESCLSAHVLNAAPGDDELGGCVVPDLEVTNSCADPLTIPNAFALNGSGTMLASDAGVMSVTIDAGATGAFQLASTEPTGATYDVSAMLGTQVVTLSFTTSH